MNKQFLRFKSTFFLLNLLICGSLVFATSCDKKDDPKDSDDNSGMNTPKPDKPEEDGEDFSSLLPGKWQAEGLFYIDCFKGTIYSTDANGIEHTETADSPGERIEGIISMHIYSNKVVTSYNEQSLEVNYKIDNDLFILENNIEDLVYRMSYVDSKLTLTKVSGPADTFPVGYPPYLWWNSQHIDENYENENGFNTNRKGYLYSYMADFGPFFRD